MLQQLVLDSGGTDPVRFSKTLLLAAMLAMLFASGAYAADANALSAVIERLLQAQSFLAALLMSAYRQQPALVLVLSALLVVPALAIVSLLIQVILRAIAWRRRLRPAVTSSEDWTRDSRPRSGVPAWPAHAWLTVDEEGHAVPLKAEVISIGRHEDNIVHIEDASVHRFHAVIHRDEDAHFIITDLSGEEGNGLRINGEKLAQAHLADGDRIELGHARLTFAAVPH